MLTVFLSVTHGGSPHQLVFVLLGGWTVTTRSLLLVDVLRDRGALLRETEDGRIENTYTLKLLNLAEAAREFTVAVDGLPGLKIVGPDQFSSTSGSIQPVTLTLSMPGDSGHSGIQPIRLLIRAKEDAATRVVEASSFVLP